MNVVFDLGGVIVAWNPDGILTRAFADQRMIGLLYRQKAAGVASYEHLLRHYALVPSETVFIDDVAVTLEAAARLGIRMIQFEAVEQCETDLRGL